MIIIDLVLFIVIGVGITNIIVNASILDKVRDYINERSESIGTLLNCMMCSGFWIGILLALFMPGIIAPLFGGVLISLFGHIYSVIIGYILTESATREKEVELLEREINKLYINDNGIEVEFERE